VITGRLRHGSELLDILMAPAADYTQRGRLTCRGGVWECTADEFGVKFDPLMVEVYAGSRCPIAEGVGIGVGSLSTYGTVVVHATVRMRIPEYGRVWLPDNVDERAYAGDGTGGIVIAGRLTRYDASLQLDRLLSQAAINIRTKHAVVKVHRWAESNLDTVNRMVDSFGWCHPVDHYDDLRRDQILRWDELIDDLEASNG
jgi:hypothetical protein